MSISLLGCRFGKHILLQKYVTCIMVSLALFLLYGTRYSLSATLAYLIHEKARNISGTEICIRRGLRTTNSKQLLEWNAGEQYYAYSSFYVGYLLFHIPSGILCDIYGAKHFLSVGLLGTGIITSIIPSILIRTPWYCTAILQALLGLMQGICMPAVISLMSHYIVPAQRTFLLSLGYSGACLGSMVSIVTSTFFVKEIQYWELLFYFWTGLIVIWYVCSTYLIFSTHYTHPFISEEEKEILAEEVGDHLPSKIPWRPLLLDTGVWALVTAQLGHSFLLFTVDTNLAKFFKRVLAIDINNDPFLIFVPYTGQWLSTIGFSLLGDYLIRMKYLPVVYTRTLYAIIGTIMPHIFIILSTYMSCNKFLIACCFTIAMSLKGTIFSGLKANILDITTHYAGVVQAIHNGLTSVTGLVSPQLIRYMCPRYTVQEWRKVLFFSLAVCLFTTTIYLVWSKGDRASWDKVPPPKTKQNIKSHIITTNK